MPAGEVAVLANAEVMGLCYRTASSDGMRGQSLDILNCSLRSLFRLMGVLAFGTPHSKRMLTTWATETGE
jgi:hypothetical protein